MKLGLATDYVGGVTFTPDDKLPLDADNAVVCMRTKNIQADLDESDLIAIPASLVKREEQFLRPGDILVSSANSWNLVAKCCYVPKLRYRAAAGGFIAVLRAKEEVVNSRYLYHWLSCDRIQTAARSCARQTTNIANLSREQFLELDLPVPSLEEQRQIVEILDKADAIRRKRQEAITLTEQLLRATFLEMFGDPVTNPKRWPWVSMDEIIHETQYGTAAKANEERRGIPVLRMNNLTNSGGLDLSEIKWCEIAPKDLAAYTVKRGDLLFNRTNSPELVGKTAVWTSDEQYAFAGYLVRVRFSESRALPHYVSGFLNSGYGKKMLFTMQKTSNNMSNISASDLRRVRLPLPDTDQQQRYHNFVETVVASAPRRQEALAQADTLFNSLVQRAFSGQ